MNYLEDVALLLKILFQISRLVRSPLLLGAATEL
jgi:hypothetical protein